MELETQIPTLKNYDGLHLPFHGQFPRLFLVDPPKDTSTQKVNGCWSFLGNDRYILFVLRVWNNFSGHSLLCTLQIYNAIDDASPGGGTKNKHKCFTISEHGSFNLHHTHIAMLSTYTTHQCHLTLYVLNPLINNNIYSFILMSPKTIFLNLNVSTNITLFELIVSKCTAELLPVMRQTP